MQEGNIANKALGAQKVLTTKVHLICTSEKYTLSLSFHQEIVVILHSAENLLKKFIQKIATIDL